MHEKLIRAKVTHFAKAYPGFCSMKRLGSIAIPLDGMLVHRRLPPLSIWTGCITVQVSTYLYRLLGGERHCDVRGHAQEHNTMTAASARARAKKKQA